MSSWSLPSLLRWSQQLPRIQSNYRTITHSVNAKCLSEPIKNTDSSSSTNQHKDMPEPDIQNPFEKEKPKCILCKFDITPNYKNVRLLTQFVSPFTGKTYGRHITGLCKAKQETVEKEIFKAQGSGLMPYYFKKPTYMKDPKLFDPENPLRPHRF